MTATTSPTPRHRALSSGARTVLLLGAASFFTDISSDMLLKLLPIFLTGTLGISVAVVGVIEGVGESTASLMRVFAGSWSDRLTRRLPVVVGGYAISSFSKPLFALVTGPVLAGVLRFADRVGKGVRTAPRDALIADVSRDERRGFWFGVHRAADSTGAVCGLLLAALIVRLSTGNGLLDRHTFQLVAVLSVIPGVLAVLVLTRIREQPRTVQPAGARRPVVELPGTAAERRYLLVVLLFALGNSSDAFLILRLVNVGTSISAVLFALAAMNLVDATIASPAGAWGDRIGRRHMLLGGYAVYASIYAGFALTHSAEAGIVLLMLYGAYYGAAEGAGRAFLADLAPEAGRGRSFGWFHAATAMAALPASVIAGVLWSVAGPGATFVFGSACALAAAAMLFTVHPPARPAQPARTGVAS